MQLEDLLTLRKITVGIIFALCITNHPTISTMKNHMLIYPALAATLLFSCGEKNKESNAEKSIEAQNEMSGEIHEGDTNLVKRDGTLLPGNIDEMDSVRLPKPVIDLIMKDEALSIDNILSTREFKENAMTYYEVEFKTAGNSTKKITFTKEGKIKT